MSKKMEYNEFLELAKKRHGNKFIYDEETKNRFNGSHSIIPIECPKHGRFEIEARRHLLYDCKECSYENRMLSLRSDTDRFKTNAIKIHGDKYDYSKVRYVTAKTPVLIVCPIHGEFWQTPNDHLCGKGCKYCKESHLERKVTLELDKRSIEYDRFHHFDWLGKQEVDFYLPKYNIAIECQGKQHIGLGGWNGRFDFKKLMDLDIRKNLLCKENGVKLLYLIDKAFYKNAVDYEIYTEENLFSELDDLINYCLNQK